MSEILSPKGMVWRNISVAEVSISCPPIGVIESMTKSNSWKGWLLTPEGVSLSWREARQFDNVWDTLESLLSCLNCIFGWGGMPVNLRDGGKSREAQSYVLNCRHKAEGKLELWWDHGPPRLTITKLLPQGRPKFSTVSPIIATAGVHMFKCVASTLQTITSSCLHWKRPWNQFPLPPKHTQNPLRKHGKTLFEITE